MSRTDPAAGASAAPQAPAVTSSAPGPEAPARRYRRGSAPGGTPGGGPRPALRPGRRDAARLRALALELTHAETRARQRLAAVLHDDVQQILAAARLHASLPDGAETVSALIGDALAATRGIAHGLAPPEATAGLSDGLREAGVAFARAHRILVEVEGRLEREPAPVVTEVALGAIRELLYNASRHAPGARVTIRLDAGAAWARVRIADDGPGFSADLARGGLGVRGVRTRIEAVGGWMDAWSGADGTVVTLCLPLPPAR